MKTLIPVILAILTLLTGCEPEVKRAESEPEPEAKKAAAAAAVESDRRVCVECKGERFIMVRNNGNNNADMRQACPICSGKGYRDLKIPTGKMLCPDCRGMGSMMDKRRAITTGLSSGNPSGRSNVGNQTFGAKVTCTRCIGTGAVFGGSTPPQR
jgi:DnaJ-class molecular chaperone